LFPHNCLEPRLLPFAETKVQAIQFERQTQELPLLPKEGTAEEDFERKMHFCLN
jgi:hypothetical protein